MRNINELRVKNLERISEIKRICYTFTSNSNATKLVKYSSNLLPQEDVVSRWDYWTFDGIMSIEERQTRDLGLIAEELGLKLKIDAKYSSLPSWICSDEIVQAMNDMELITFNEDRTEAYPTDKVRAIVKTATIFMEGQK